MFGITVSGRSTQVKGIEDMVGLFINTVPLRLRIFPGDKVREVLRRITKILLGMEEFECTPLVRLIADKDRGLPDVLFDSVVVIQNYPVDDRLSKKQGHLHIKLTSRFYMTRINLVLGIRVFDRVILDFSYNEKAFKARTIEKLSRQLVTLIKTLVADFDQEAGFPAGSPLKVRDLESLGQREKKQLVFNSRENRKKLKAVEEVDFDEIF